MRSHARFFTTDHHYMSWLPVSAYPGRFLRFSGQCVRFGVATHPILIARMALRSKTMCLELPLSNELLLSSWGYNSMKCTSKSFLHNCTGVISLLRYSQHSVNFVLTVRIYWLQFTALSEFWSRSEFRKTVLIEQNANLNQYFTL
jgi:hypothetical protein